MCCKDSTIFSLSPHLCATDFPHKEHSLFLPLLFPSSSPFPVLTLASSRAASHAFRSFAFDFTKQAVYHSQKQENFSTKHPNFSQKVPLFSWIVAHIFISSKQKASFVHHFLIDCPEFWPPSSLRHTTSTYLYQLVSLHLLPPCPARPLPPRARVCSLAATSPFWPFSKPKPPLPTSIHRKVPTLLRQNASRE